ncbi:PAS domain-containing sensor histidine kinase [Silvibacterium acidisoli]|uniref:PAS domain-containing sensor histidine kinase n=1 Tax=Acidobacteriaceae bacterium ZG23-2 TaxID=2883246 RepID=UPI00406D347A
MLFREIADTAPVLIWLSDSTAQCTWYNRPWLEFRGRTMEQELGSGWSEGVHPEDLENCVKLYLDSFGKRLPFCLEYRLKQYDGEYRWMLERGAPRFSEPGSFLGYIGTCVDITEIREIRRNSSKYLGELAAIVESSDDVILSKDLNGIVTSWNATATRIFGYSAEEMIGNSILKLIPENLHADENKILENIRAGRRVQHFETVRLTKAGELLDVSLTVSPVKDEHGNIIGASKILRDISDRKRIEKSLLNAEKIAATGRMAATIAHEINNPLEAVMNLLYLLRSTITDPQGLQYLETAESELNRVSHIAKQTLGYYREHASATPLSMAEIVQHVCMIYAPRCAAAGIRIDKRLEPVQAVMMRRGEIVQVISNLLANSIYAMSEGGALTVTVEESPQGVLLTVTDNGVGISLENIGRVFEPFFTTRSTVGTGIGLFIARQFVEGHGGSISLESSVQPESHGTTVRVALPLKTLYENPA